MLVNCPECNKERVSDQALACPFCGYPVARHYQIIHEAKHREKLQKEAIKKRENEEKEAREKIEKYNQMTKNEKAKIEAERRKAIAESKKREEEKVWKERQEKLNKIQERRKEGKCGECGGELRTPKEPGQYMSGFHCWFCTRTYKTKYE